MSEKIHGETLFASYGTITSPNEYRFDGMDKREMAEARYFVERPRLRLKDPACAGEDSTKWYPEPERGLRGSYEWLIKENAEALNLCYACPDRVACLQYALDNEESGIWGGIVESARRNVDGMSAEWLIAHDRKRRTELSLQ